MKAHTEALEIAGRQRLAELEKVIHRGKKSFVEVGLALAEIRDMRLYKPEFKTFMDYCKEKWGWGKGYCNHVIRAAQVVGALPETATIVATEAQARELARAPKAARGVVLEAAAVAGPLTARAIRQAGSGRRGRAEVLSASGTRASSAPLPPREAAVSLEAEVLPAYRIVNGRCVVLQTGWTFGRRVLRKLLKEVTAD